MGNQSSGNCQSGISILANRTRSPIRRTFFWVPACTEAHEGIATFNENATELRPCLINPKQLSLTRHKISDGGQGAASPGVKVL